MGCFIVIDMSFGNWLIYLCKDVKWEIIVYDVIYFIGYWYLRYMYVVIKFKCMMYIVFNVIFVILLKWVGYVIKNFCDVV